MATNFSPCKGSYVLNQFPSTVMFGMNGFHLSASGAIQGHHGPLVFFFFNDVPIYKILDWYKLEEFADNNLLQTRKNKGWACVGKG